jgi:Holliday junction DNA helicase RuvA
MRDRLPALGIDTGTTAQPEMATGVAISGQNDAMKDAISALIALGYKPQEASRMVNGVDAGTLSSEEIIRQALKSVSL